MASYDLGAVIEGFSPLMRVLTDCLTLDQFIEQSGLVGEELEYVKELAQEYIGTQQGAAGPFQAWPDLAPSTIAERQRLGFSDDGAELLREGDLRDAIQVMPDSDGMGGAVGIPAGDPNAEKGYVLELGSLAGQIPERSYLRRAMYEAAPEIHSQWDALVRLVLTGRGLSALQRLPPPEG